MSSAAFPLFLLALFGASVLAAPWLAALLGAYWTWADRKIEEIKGRRR